MIITLHPNISIPLFTNPFFYRNCSYNLIMTIYLCEAYTPASNLRNKIIKKNCSHHDFYLPTREKIALPYTSPNMVQYLLRDQL